LASATSASVSARRPTGADWALGDDNGCGDAVVECLDVHVGLVGLNDDEAVAFGEDIALGVDPQDDFTFRHGGAEGGHEDLPNPRFHRQEGRRREATVDEKGSVVGGEKGEGIVRKWKGLKEKKEERV